MAGWRVWRQLKAAWVAGGVPKVHIRTSTVTTVVDILNKIKFPELTYNLFNNEHR